MIISKENCSVLVRAALIFLMVGFAQSAPRPIASSATSMQLSSSRNADSTTTATIPSRSTSQDANDNFDMHLPTRPDFQRMLSHRSHDALKNLLENSRTTQETRKVSQPTVAGTATTTSNTIAETEVVTLLEGSAESWTETGQHQQGSENYNDHSTEGAATKDNSAYDVGTTQYIGMPLKPATVSPAELSVAEELVSGTTTLFVVKTTIPPPRHKAVSLTHHSTYSSEGSPSDLPAVVQTAKIAEEVDHIPARISTAEYDDALKTTMAPAQLTSTFVKPPSLPIAPPRTRGGQSPRFDEDEKTDSNSTAGKTTSTDTTIMEDDFPVSTASGVSAAPEFATEPASIPLERTTSVTNSTTISETVVTPVVAMNSFKHKAKINKGAGEKGAGGKAVGSSSTSKKKSGVTIMGHDGVKVTRKKQLLEKSYRDDVNPAAATAVRITAAAVAIPVKEALEGGENRKIMEPIMTVGATIMSISTAVPSSPDFVSDSMVNVDDITGAARIHPTIIRDNGKSMDARVAEMEAENELWSGYDTKKIYFTTSSPAGTIVNDMQTTKSPPANSIDTTAANPDEPETIISLSSTPRTDAESTETDSTPEAIDTRVNVTDGASLATKPFASIATTTIADATTISTTRRSANRFTSTFVTTVELNNSSSSASIDDVSVTLVTKEVQTAATPSSASLPRTSKADKLNETDILVVEITSADNNTTDMLSHEDSAYNGNTIPKFTIHNDGISEYDSGNTRPYGAGAEIDYENSKSQADDELFVPDLKLEAIDEGPSVTVSAKEKSNGGQRETIDRDSDTIFYISNTEVKVMESKPTQNSKLVSMEKSSSDLNSNFNSHRPSVDSQYFPSIYEEDVIIDFPAQNITYGVAPNQASSTKDDDASSKAQIYEEDIILSPLKNNFDPLKIIANRNANAIEQKVRGSSESATGIRHISPLSLENNPALTYIGEKLIEVEPSQTDSPITFPQQSPNNSETPLEVNESLVPISDVIIQPAIIPEMSIGVPVIGELPPQIELKEIDFLADNPMVGSQGSNGLSSSGSNAMNDLNGEKFDGIQYGGDLFAHDASVLTGSSGYEMDTEYIFGGRHHSYDNANGYNPLNDPIKVSRDKNLDNERNMAASYDGNNDVTVASRIFMNAVGNLQKDQLIAEVRSGFKELSARHSMNANGTGSAENLTNATAYSVMEEADGDFLNFTDMQTLFLACFATLVPLILCVLLAVGLRGRATFKAITKKFVRPGVTKDVHRWARACTSCQRCKVEWHQKNVPQQFVVPDERFQHIHLDIVGPLILCQGYKYCLTVIDRFFRWSEAIPRRDQTAESVAKAFFSNWVAHFGTPSTVTTDQGTQFESELFRSLTHIIGCERNRTSPYHPASNGLVERWHHSLKAAIMCHERNPEWVDILPKVLLGLRNAVKDDIGASSAEMVYGTTLTLPGDFLIPSSRATDASLFLKNLRETMRQIKPTATSSHSSQHPFASKYLKHCTHAFLRVDNVRKALVQPFTEPHKILRRLSDILFTVDVKGRPINVSTERLKPAFLDDTRGILSQLFKP